MNHSGLLLNVSVNVILSGSTEQRYILICVMFDS